MFCHNAHEGLILGYEVRCLDTQNYGKANRHYRKKSSFNYITIPTKILLNIKYILLNDNTFIFRYFIL